MAIKERLLKQLNIVQDGLNAMPPFHSRDLNAMRNALVQARDLCFQGLPEKSFAAYKDTYDGLLLAIDQLAANAPDKEEIVSLCSELLQHTIVQTQKETAFKKEIFFLPYKASMWDSLESVWKAADEDKEHCIAYVMPIPYADLTPEHTVAEWHYEKGMFPEDVPTVDWEDFDLQAMHPDVIFIHNPYDEYNRVTSVESRFYSSKLKDQTEKLVYIPYFVLAEPELDGKSEEEIEKIEEGIEGFILTPAVLNAHQVVVQSEAMRQVYIDVLTRKTDKTDRAFWEKRILGTGSPKFDKVASSKKEDLDIPDEWLKIIEKPDGSWKKIVFYNTGLSALLENDEKMLAKMRQVFQILKEHQDEVALLWRPHPLIPATIKSMRPQLEKMYKEIVQQYIEAGWGIFDDSGDLDRAIVLSDAYYGDWSSVVKLYEKTFKPLIIQNLNHFDASQNDAVHHNNEVLSFENFYIDNDTCYFTSNTFNGLFKIKKDDLLSSENDNIYADFLCCPSDENTHQRLWSSIVKYDNKLVLIPFSSNFIIVYNISNHHVNLIELDDHISTPYKTVNYTPKAKFSFGLVYQNSIFLFPYSYPRIVILNMETLTVTYIEQPISCLSAYIENSAMYFGRPLDNAINGNSVNLWSPSTNSFVNFCFSNSTLSLTKKIDKLGVFQQALSFGGFYWLIPLLKGYNIIKISCDFNRIDFIPWPKDYVTGERPFADSVCTDKEIWILSKMASHSIAFRSGSKGLKKIPIIKKFDTNNFNYWNFLFAIRYANLICAYNTYKQSIVVINTNTSRLHVHKVFLKKEHAAENKRLKLELFHNTLNQNFGNAICEDEIRDLNMLIHYLTSFQSEQPKQNEDSELSSNGKMIFDEQLKGR